MAQDVPSKIHEIVPIIGAISSVAAILTGSYTLATGKIAKEKPLLVYLGIGAALAGLGFLVYRETLRVTKPQGVDGVR